MNQLRSIETRLRGKLQAMRSAKPELAQEINAVECKLNNALRKNNISEARSAEKELTNLEQGKAYQKQPTDAEKLEALTKAHAKNAFLSKSWRRG